VIDFESLYREHAAAVFRFALSLSGDRTVAEDITSETFVRAWVESDKLRVGTVKAYLFMIARNLHVDWRRLEARRGEMVQEPADPSPGPQDEAGARDQLKAVIAALQQLPEIDRAALLMRSQDDMPYETIAAALGLTPVAARVKVHRARMKLASLCGKEDGC